MMPIDGIDATMIVGRNVNGIQAGIRTSFVALIGLWVVPTGALACDCIFGSSKGLFQTLGVMAEGVIIRSVKPMGSRNGKAMLKVTSADKGARPGETLTLSISPESSCAPEPPKVGQRLKLSGIWSAGSVLPSNGAGCVSAFARQNDTGMDPVLAGHRAETARLSALAEGSANASDWDALASYLSREGDHRFAIEAFSKAAAAEPDKGRRFEVAQSQLAMKDPASAIKTLAGDKDARAVLLMGEARQEALGDPTYQCDRGTRRQAVSLKGRSLADRNLERVSLSLLDLTGMDAPRVSLDSAKLRCVVLDGSNLSDANLHGIELRSVSLRQADLSRSNASGIRIEGSDLTSAKAVKWQARGISLSGSNLRGADLRGADLSGSYLDSSDLDEALLDGADLSGARYDCKTRFPVGFQKVGLVGPKKECAPEPVKAGYPF